MRPILPVLGILSALWLFGGTWWLSNLVCGSEQTLSVSDGSFSTQSQDLFSFQYAGYQPKYGGETERAFKEVVGHMKKNPDRILTLSGLFATKEKNDGNHENLGIARAESIKSLLVSFGADEEQINTSGERLDNLSFVDKNLSGGVHFSFDGKPEPVESVGDVTETGAAGVSSSSSDGSAVLEPLMLLFEPEQVSYKSTSDLNSVDYINALKVFLAGHPGSKVMVTGHTGKGGSETEMETLSKERARKIRRVLRDAGLKSHEVVAVGKGFSEPVVDHDASDAAEKNNRVVVTVVR